MDISREKQGALFRKSDSVEFETRDGGRGDVEMESPSTSNKKRNSGNRCVTKTFCNGVKVPVFVYDSGEEEETPVVRGHSSNSGGHYVTKKFCNGVKVPVFPEESTTIQNSGGRSKKPFNGAKGFPTDESQDDCQSHSVTRRSEQMDKTRTSPEISPCNSNTDLFDRNKTHTEGSMPLGQLIDFCQCPICMDLMIEVTAVSCGHTFCGSCITQWTKMKPICPICSKEITCKTRLYNHDLLIDTILRDFDEFPKELGLRNYEAKAARMDRQVAENKVGKSFLGAFRNKMDDTVLSLKCKGLLGTLKNSRPINRIRQRLNSHVIHGAFVPKVRKDWEFGKKYFLISGIVIGALGAVCISNFLSGTNFFEYMYLAIIQYDGTIPPYFIDENYSDSKISMKNNGSTNMTPLNNRAPPHPTNQGTMMSLMNLFGY